MKERYYGKLILFGEYSMIFDSRALVIPMKRYAARWEQGQDERLRFSNGELRRFARFLTAEPRLSEAFDMSAMHDDLDKGWALASSIPFGYGLGSSGTVVAAVYDRYARRRIPDVPEMKTLFARMEAFFHGSSSGIDPLQSYFGKPFQSSADGICLLPDDFLPKGICIGLLDTGVKSNTRPLVNGFKKQRENPVFLQDFEQDYLPCVNTCMDSLIREDRPMFFAALKALQQAQLRFFRRMIPDCVLPLFMKTYDMNLAVKILGSGGGGYMLVFTDDPEAASSHSGFSEVQWLTQKV